MAIDLIRAKRLRVLLAVNNGLVIVVSKNLKQTAISTGFGTEKILTDLICKKVIDSVMIPEFKKDEFSTGIKKGLAELISKWK